MGSFTNYLEEKLLNYVFGGESYNPPNKLYVGLSSTSINEDGTGITEPSEEEYNRVEVDNNLNTWSVADQNGDEVSIKYNLINIEFPEAENEEGWGIFTHFFVADELEGGNILGYGELDESVEILENNVVRFEDETLFIKLD